MQVEVEEQNRKDFNDDNVDLRTNSLESILDAPWHFTADDAQYIFSRHLQVVVLVTSW